MTTLRTLVSALLSKSVLSAGWYSMLTGLVLMIVGLRWRRCLTMTLLRVSSAGLWQLERGVRSEFQRRPRPSDDDS